MKIRPECIPCILTVRVNELMRLITDEEKLKQAVKELLSFMAENLDYDEYVTVYATNAFRLVKKLSGNNDPYREVKVYSNKVTLRILNEVERKISSLQGYSAFREACLAALAGNAIDFGVAGYSARIEDFSKEVEQIKLAVDDSKKVFEEISSRKMKILYLMDNCGEAVLDILLIKQLTAMGHEVVAVVKSGSFQNDITLKEAEEIELSKYCKVIGSGTDGSSIFWNEVSSELKEEYMNSDLVISKGMANFEYLSEANIPSKPVVYMLKAKCRNIAKELGVNVGDYVIKLSETGYLS